MAMGRKARERQGEFWIATESLPETPRHVFYEKLNGILAEGDFDRFVETLCEPYYAEGFGRTSPPGAVRLKAGRSRRVDRSAWPGIRIEPRERPPGIYFRMLLIGYFEGIDSQRGIAWRCADSRSLAGFLGYFPREETPDLPA